MKKEADTITRTMKRIVVSADYDPNRPAIWNSDTGEQWTHDDEEEENRRLEGIFNSIPPDDEGDEPTNPFGLGGKDSLLDLLSREGISITGRLADNRTLLDEIFRVVLRFKENY
jgi:hypothetical protein